MRNAYRDIFANTRYGFSANVTLHYSFRTKSVITHYSFLITHFNYIAMKKEFWKKIIQIVITILTAISSTILVQSCYNA